MTNMYKPMLAITHVVAVLVGYLVGVRSVQANQEDRSSELIFVASILGTKVSGKVAELGEWRTFLALDQQGEPFICQRITLQTNGEEVYWVPKGHTLEKGAQTTLVMSGFHSNHMNPIGEQEGAQLL